MNLRNNCTLAAGIPVAEWTFFVKGGGGGTNACLCNILLCRKRSKGDRFIFFWNQIVTTACGRIDAPKDLFRKRPWLRIEPYNSVKCKSFTRNRNYVRGLVTETVHNANSNGKLIVPCEIRLTSSKRQQFTKNYSVQSFKKQNKKR